MSKMVYVIGAGLAGSEAAYALSNAGIDVTLYEMRPKKNTPAHKTEGFAELVCSNSLKAMRLNSAGGLLKAEMEMMGSLVVKAAKMCQVPAGDALAVDRYKFSEIITNEIKSRKNITIVNDELTEIPKDGYVIIATGPLTSDSLSNTIAKLTGSQGLHFYDAAAPIVSFDSIDMTKAFKASRYGRGEDDYINCPMNKEEYEIFYEALVNAERALLHDIDKPDVYEGCMPVEILARRGHDSIRFGPLKPVGLTDPRTGHRPWAVVQLRAENSEGSMYNLVGFQTNLKFPEQKRVFSLIPGLENAEFIRYGVMHRNTFIDSPRLLDEHFRLKKDPRIRFAGQITGVEGYTESASSGIINGINLARELNGQKPLELPLTTMVGALSHYISDESVKDFQPMGANMGILPSLETNIKQKQERYDLISKRSLSDLEKALKG